METPNTVGGALNNLPIKTVRRWNRIHARTVANVRDGFAVRRTSFARDGQTRRSADHRKAATPPHWPLSRAFARRCRRSPATLPPELQMQIRSPINRFSCGRRLDGWFVKV